MKALTNLLFLLILVSCTHPQLTSVSSAPATSVPSTTAIQDPAELYGELFERVQLMPLFKDSKYFVDMVPKFSPETILAAFKLQNPKTKEELRNFVQQSFLPPLEPASNYKSDANAPIETHIKKLWTYLKREPEDEANAGSSLIALPYSYVVPGGRFREIYYWDSYFTQLGLLADNEEELFQNMVKNFSHLLLKAGRIPNGNRDYYRGRSQPPFFSHMIALWRSRFGNQSAVQFLPALKQEHAFWMQGQASLKIGAASARVVRLSEDVILNRYWDDKPAPRPEAYKEDVELAAHATKNLNRKAEEVYRDLRAGAESGWDYSSRWFKNPNDFASIQTTAIIPIDLNSLLYHLERTLSELYKASGNEKAAFEFENLAEARRAAIIQYCWDEKTGTFQDYNWQTKQKTGELTLALVAPLFVGLATTEQAKRVERVLEQRFLKPGGLVTTLRRSRQQWDSPNGWPPHQWMAYAGLKRYGPSVVANKISERWLALNKRVYKSTGKLMEKYNVIDLNLKSGGGEYPTQDGFGWTNGVYRALSTPVESMKHIIQ